MKKTKENQDHKKAFKLLSKVVDKRTAGKENAGQFDAKG